MTAFGMRMRQLNPNDEYYTRYEDIENIMIKYKDKLVNKTIYMCCDNPNVSNFWKYFKNNYHIFRYKEIIATYYSECGISKKRTYNGISEYTTLMRTNGDVLNKECYDIIQNSDVIITNPPFSKIKDLLNIIRDKEYILVAPFTVIQHLMNEIVDGRVWCQGVCTKFIYEDKIKCVNNGIWVSNIFIGELPDMYLTKSIRDIKKEFIDNTEILNIDKCSEIPYDYNKEMGVPITLFKKLSYNQFRVLGIINHPYLNGKTKFKRLIIKLKGYDIK